jgi:hypothetical protein
MTTPETIVKEELTELIARLRTCQERYAEMAAVAEVAGWESIRLAAGAMSAELAEYLERFQRRERSYFFTFGFDHVHPTTGEPLSRKYMEIIAPDSEQARKLMVKLFGTKWAFQYDSVDQFGATKYSLTRLEILRAEKGDNHE